MRCRRSSEEPAKCEQWSWIESTGDTHTKTKGERSATTRRSGWMVSGSGGNGGAVG